MSDGTQAGALIGSDLLAVSQDDEKVEISRDSWTVERDLLFGGKKPRQLVLPQPTRPRTGSGGSGKKKTVATSGGSSRSRIVIVRGTSSQAINVK